MEVKHIGALPIALPPSSRRESENCVTEIVHMNSDGYVSSFV